MPDPDVPAPLRIVAIGASAGGLEPIERLFAELGAGSGCAFVIVQHLSPDFRSMMGELLARHTTMDIRRLEDGMTLAPDCIHLNVPRSLTTLEGTRVRLEPFTDVARVNRSIDALLSSLAEQHGERALAVLLSGTGTDGRDGCDRVRARGGKVIVQAPDEARFDSMPRAVVEAGLADAVAASDALTAEVRRWIDGEAFPPLSRPDRLAVDPATDRPTSPSERDDSASRASSDASDRARQRALERIVADHAPPGFLITDDGELVHVFGAARGLLPVRPGAFSRRLTERVHPELRAPLFAALQIARKPDFERFSRRVSVRGQDAAHDPVVHDMTLSRVPGGESEAAGFLLMTIAPSERSGGATDGSGDVRPIGPDADERTLRERIRRLEEDLHASELGLQTTIEALETTNRALQHTNEDLTNSNEELQSTNEELHSVNEELYTLGGEHQRKIEELSALTADVDHLLSSSEIGTVFLDRKLRLRRCNDRAQALLGLGPGDIGREIDGARSAVPGHVSALPRQVLDTRAPLEIDTVLGERRHLLRLLPHLDGGGEIDGVLMTTVDITELTETRRELGRIDEEYRSIVEDTSSFIVRWRASDGAITYCNEAYAGFFDGSGESLLGRDILSLIPPAERAGFAAEIASIEPGESRFLSVVRDEPDGGATYTVGFTRAIADADGHIVEYQSTGQDMSEEYAYRRALERLVATTKDPALDHQERLQRILRLGLAYLRLESGLVSRIDGEDYHVLAIAGEAAHTRSPGDVLALSETVCANLPNGDAVLVVDHLADSPFGDHPCHAATGVESFIGARLSTAEGPYGSVAFSSRAPRDRPFNAAESSFVLLVNSWIGHMLDSQHQLERVARSNDYYQSLYLGLPVVICLTDREGRIVEVSDEWLAHLGQAREATVGTPFVASLADESRERASEAIRHGSADALSLCVLRADGESVKHEMSCRSRAIGTRQDMRLIVLSDVSERDRAIDDVRSRNVELADVNENLNQFAFVASHDLQEPLRKIQQFSGFLVEDAGDALSEDDRYHLEVIVEAASRMSTLIRDLLQYSRASRNTLVRERVALDAVLAQAGVDLELPLQESGAGLTIDPLPEVPGDPVLLLQLFTNLLSNAIKYRDKGRPLTIEVRHFPMTSDADHPGPRIDIVDNGIGFDPAYRGKVFEPFTRLHASKDYPGSGIGLAICATVCRKHGWRIVAESEKGRGCTFSLLLDRPVVSPTLPGPPGARNAVAEGAAADG